MQRREADSHHGPAQVNPFRRGNRFHPTSDRNVAISVITSSYHQLSLSPLAETASVQGLSEPETVPQTPVPLIRPAPKGRSLEAGVHAAPHPAMTTTTEMRQHPGHPQNSKIFLLQLNFHHRAEKAEQLPATGRRQPASFGRCAFSNSQTLPKHAGPRRTSVNAPLLWRWVGSCSPNCCALPWNLSIFRDRAFKEAIKIKRNYTGGR